MVSRFKQTWWLWAAWALTVLKLWLTRGQPVFAIGPAIHDDRLFLNLADNILNGDWLGPYNQLTLAKGPFYSLWIAFVFLLGVPLVLAQQIAYAAACAAVVRALRPWIRPGAALLAAYALLLWNPMTFEGHNLARIMRQNLYTPLALLVFASLIALCARRQLPLRKQALWAALGGGAFGAFWLTREESVWILPAVALLGAAYLTGLRIEPVTRWRTMLAALGIALVAAAVPVLSVSWMNYRHYGWFGTVEFHAGDFNDAYGALARISTGPELPMVPVTRQMREAAYAMSPTFADLRPQLEGPVGDKWSDKEHFPAAERQIGGGWFIWALRDAVAASGHASNAGEAMAFYRRMADEINRACDSGRIPAGSRRSGFLPPIQTGVPAKLWQSGLEFARYFTSFSSFTARVPPSIGDNQDVRPFRDLTHEDLSPGERLTTEAAPDQERIRSLQIDWLEAIGRNVGRVLGFLVPLANLVALARLLECAWRRQFTYPLAVAGAAWLACAAYLAVNVLVHVTSFFNLTPAALASAYPLEILFVIAVAIDTATAWIGNRPVADTPVPAPPLPALSRRALAGGWLWVAGAAGVVFAARLGEIFLHGSDVPFNDQWKIEAADILRPWVTGTLSPFAFFAPHYEHLPVWTRLLAWLEVVVTGRWDPLVQTTVNAVLYAGFVGLVVRWVQTSLAMLAAVAVTLVVVACGALPHGWENSTWGFQSQFPLALIFLFLHARGSFAFAPGSRGWWWAQGAGVAGLFTLASMWTAPLAVVAVSLWTGQRGSRLRLAPLLIAGAGLVPLAVIHATLRSGGSFAQTAGSGLQFFHAWLDLLGWPAGWAGSAVLLNAPLFAVALQLRRRRDASAFDCTLLALGVWSVAQAASLAFARGGDYSGYVSRYGELLVVGVLANALALVRLRDVARPWRPVLPLLAAGWTITIAFGLADVSYSGHAGYFHQVSAERAHIRREAVQHYLASKDSTLLEAASTRWILYQDVGQIISLLDEPRFRALLPSSVNPASPPDLAGRAARWLQRRWLGLILVSGIALILGLSSSRRSAGDSAAVTELKCLPDNLRLRLVAGVGAAAAVGIFFWPAPLTFDQLVRWRQLISPPAAVKDLRFEFVGAALFPNSRLDGAARIMPEDLRNYFYGTQPEGPELLCTVRSSPFRINLPWLVVPDAGFPVAEGNALHVRVEDEAGNLVADITCPGPNPTDLGFWLVDVRQYQGRSARLLLVDGRATTEAWVAAAPPLATADERLAGKLARRLALERVAGTHTTLGFIALACFGWCGLATLAAFFRRNF